MRPPPVIARKTLVHFLNTVLGALVGVLALKFIALYMGDALFGQVAYALSLTGILFSLMQFGLPQAHKKKLAEGIREPDRVATYLWTQVVIMTIYFLGVMGFIAFRVHVQGKGFNDTTLITLVVMGVYWTSRFLWKWLHTTHVAHRQVARDQVADVAEDFVRAGGSALVAISYAAVANQSGPLASHLGPGFGWLADYGAEALAATYLAGSLAGVVIALFYVLRHHEIGSFDRSILRDYWDFGRPLYLVSILGTVSTKLDRVMLGYFWTDATVGLYFGADRVVSIVNTIAFSIGTLLLPAVSSLSVEGSEEEIVDITYRAHRYTTMTVLPMVLGLVVFAEPVIHLILSDDFLRGAPVLGILAVYSLLNVTARPYSSLISGMDMPHLAARVGMLAAGTNIVLNLVLVPADIKSLGITLLGLKATGAALATLASGVISYTLYRRIAGRVVDLRPQWPHLLRQLIAGSFMAGVLHVLNTEVVGLARWYHLLLFGVLGGAIYVLALAVVGEFTRDDLDFFLDIVHPGKMFDYIRDELRGDD